MRDMAEGTRHFSPESLVKNRVEPIACIPRCSTRVDLSRFSETPARDPRKMCRENGAEGRMPSLLS